MFEKFGFKCSATDKILLLLFLYLLYRSTSIGISFFVIIFSILSYLFIFRLRMIDRLSIYIFGFAVSYSVLSFIYTESFNPHNFLYLLAPNAFYFWGKHMIGICKRKMAIVNFLLIVLLFFALNTYILTIKDINEVGWVNPFRGMLRVGDSDVAMPATLFGLNVSLGLSGLAIVLSLPKSFMNLKSLVFLIILFFSLLTNIHLTNRTGLFVFVASTLTVYLFTLISKNKSDKYFVGIILISILVYLIYSNFGSSSEFVDAYAQREQSSGQQISGYGDRGWRWIDALGRIFYCPLGWSGQAPYNYAHNLWLDVAMQRGIVPFIFLVFATFYSIKNTLKSIKVKNDYIVMSFLGLTVCFFLTSFVEPVMIGFDVYFYLYCMLWGMQTAYNKSELRCLSKK